MHTASALLLIFYISLTAFHWQHFKVINFPRWMFYCCILVLLCYFVAWNLSRIIFVSRAIHFQLHTQNVLYNLFCNIFLYFSNPFFLLKFEIFYASLYSYANVFFMRTIFIFLILNASLCLTCNTPFKPSKKCGYALHISVYWLYLSILLYISAFILFSASACLFCSLHMLLIFIRLKYFILYKIKSSIFFIPFFQFCYFYKYYTLYLLLCCLVAKYLLFILWWHFSQSQQYHCQFLTWDLAIFIVAHAAQYGLLESF